MTLLAGELENYTNGFSSGVLQGCEGMWMVEETHRWWN